MTENDYEGVMKVYQMGIDSNLATFRRNLPSKEEFFSSHMSFGRYVAVESGLITGFAVISRPYVSEHYNGVYELTIYIHNDYKHQNIGTELLEKVKESVLNNSGWTIESHIMRDNIPSINFHLKNGFRIVGYRGKLGKLNGSWLDTVLLEYRNNKE